ncbi:MAG: serine/threonine-protein kinase [Ktedonobacteraceae bacterium]
MPLEALQNGRYHILRTLGSGSMGEVYLVDDTRINRQVAIKVIRTEGMPYPDTDPNRDAARLFEREAKAIARLNHPNILPLYDFGEEVVNGVPLTYMVMPYCPDGSLAGWLQQRGPTPKLALPEVAHFVRQAGDALQHAHDNQIIHQDVKPQNFLLRSNKSADLPDLLLADFGIAKLAVGTSGASQAIRGTPIYMAPEQWEGNPLPASDQYALAIMAYLLLTGRTPFEGGPGQMMYQHFSVAPQPPSKFNPAINANVDRVILRALAKNPQERFPSVAAFNSAFQQAVMMDAPTFMQGQGATLNRSQGGNINAMLAISSEEALNGTSRTLTLAGGQRVRVTIPPRTQNGQVIHTLGQDISNGGGVIPLVLTMSVATAPENIHTILNDEGTMAGGYTNAGQPTVGNNPIVLTGRGSGGYYNNPTVQPGGGSGSYGSRTAAGTGSSPYYTDYGNNAASPYRDNRMAPPGERRPRTGLAIFIIVLVLLLILGGAGTLFYLYGQGTNTANNGADATSTASANSASATAQNSDALTAQANANATNTAQSQSNTDATATAQANASATTQANATATANAGSANTTATAIAGSTATAVSATATASATLPAPTQISPANGTVFNNSPRTTTLKWSSVPSAASYSVEIDYYDNGSTTCTGGRPLKTATGLTDTSYTFNFVGAQPGCWRVWAVNDSSQPGQKSNWWEFSYTV